MLSAGLSVVIKEKKNQRIIGACLNFDARSKEAEPLCACAAFSRNNVNNNEDNEALVHFLFPSSIFVSNTHLRLKGN